MDVEQIRKVGRALPRFLDEFSDCFGRCDTRAYLKVYVKGQLSDLQRKSAEPMALRAGIPPRSLQAFLGLLEWNEDRRVDRLQWIVARDQAHPGPSASWRRRVAARTAGTPPARNGSGAGRWARSKTVWSAFTWAIA